MRQAVRKKPKGQKGVKNREKVSTGISVETRMSNGQLFAIGCSELSGSRRQSKRKQ